MTNSQTIDQVQAECRNLESEIMDSLTRFRERTGLAVAGISVKTMQYRRVEALRESTIPAGVEVQLERL